MEEVRSRVIMLRNKSDKVNQKVLRWLGLVESMNGERLTIR